MPIIFVGTKAEFDFILIAAKCRDMQNERTSISQKQTPLNLRSINQSVPTPIGTDEQGAV